MAGSRLPSVAFTTWVDYPGTPSVPTAADLNRLQANQAFMLNPDAWDLQRTYGGNDLVNPGADWVPMFWNKNAVNVNDMTTGYANDYTVTPIPPIVTIQTPGYYLTHCDFTVKVPARPAGGFTVGLFVNDTLQVAYDEETFDTRTAGTFVTLQITHRDYFAAGVTLQIKVQNLSGLVVFFQEIAFTPRWWGRWDGMQ